MNILPLQRCVPPCFTFAHRRDRENRSPCRKNGPVVRNFFARQFRENAGTFSHSPPSKSFTFGVEKNLLWSID
jgi:hypothetical protein